MEYTKPLVQQVKESGDLTPIRERVLRTYYTCIRYMSVETDTVPYRGALGTPLTYYGPGQWSCMKGWFESYDNTFKGKMFDSKVIKFCKFRDTEVVLAKELGEPFVLFSAGTQSKN